MSRERWGTFSVIDHKDAAALVPDVLLYDRLVLPYPPNEEERRRWESNGWRPDLLDRRLGQLGPDLAITAAWGLERRARCDELMERLRLTQFDADKMVEEVREALPYQLSRMVLQRDPPKDLPRGVTKVVTVAAYQSEADIKAHFVVERPTPSQDQGTLALLFAQRLAVPEDRDPEKALAKAVELATKHEKFREHRRKLYEWQEQVLREGVAAEDAIREMDEMIAAYNRVVETAVRQVYYKFRFTLAGAAMAIAGAVLGSPLATASALLTVAKFATFDLHPVIEPGENAPAAMFHDFQSSIAPGLRLA